MGDRDDDAGVPFVIWFNITGCDHTSISVLLQEVNDLQYMNSVVRQVPNEGRTFHDESPQENQGEFTNSRA
ncbi:hypothetical protein OAS39_01300 [Pirellulales bacterium]|nr:hypothetical protein [Pirellulales bacterium]